MAVNETNVLIIVNNWGIEETELTRPLRDLRKAGARVTVAATTLDPCETVRHDRYEGETITPDALLSDVQAADYDLLVVPGGTCNVDRLRVNPDAIALAQEFAHEGKPIAAICHGPWLLVNRPAAWQDADLLPLHQGRRGERRRFARGQGGVLVRRERMDADHLAQAR